MKFPVALLAAAHEHLIRIQWRRDHAHGRRLQRFGGFGVHDDPSGDRDHPRANELHAEYTTYGSGMPIVSSTRGLLETP